MAILSLCPVLVNFIHLLAMIESIFDFFSFLDHGYRQMIFSSTVGDAKELPQRQVSKSSFL